MEKVSKDNKRRVITKFVPKGEELDIIVYCRGRTIISLMGPAEDSPIVMIDAYASDEQLFIEVRSENWNKIWSYKI